MKKKENFTKSKRKIHIGLTLIIEFIIILTLLFAIFLVKNPNGFSSIFKMSNEQKVQKGYKVFGHDYCEGHPSLEIAGQAFTPWTCQICGYSDEHSNSSAPIICHSCAEITGRCYKCGKLQFVEQIK